MKIETDLTFLLNRDGAEIEIRDVNANVVFCKISLNQEQLCAILSRLSHVKVQADINIDNVGKKHENKSFTFATSVASIYDSNAIEILNKECIDALHREGLTEWKPDKYYGSQQSLHIKDGIRYARATIRRWI